MPARLSRPRETNPTDGRQALLAHFESLGENCELGFVQEHMGVHTIGLFKWSGIDLGNLITALETGLAGIGGPENSSIYTDEFQREFYFKDMRYGMVTHTRMFEHEVEAEKAFSTLCRRTQRLSEKLLEDFAGGQKIFVFQSVAPAPMADLLRLHAAVRRLGPAAELLYIHPAEPGRRAGRVKRLMPGLMVGVIDKVGLNGVTWVISYEVWLSLLARAARMCGRKVSSGVTEGLEALDLPRRF